MHVLLIHSGKQNQVYMGDLPSATAVASEDLIDTLKRWKEATNRGITLVTAGRSGAGKSTLVCNILGLEGEGAPKHEHTPSSVTQSVKLYESEVEGVKVQIVDTPGLAAHDMNKAKVIAELTKVTGGKADMLLYCVSTLPDSKIADVDKQIIKVLTLAFGERVWERAILVLTFANMVRTLSDEKDREVWKNDGRLRRGISKNVTLC